MADVTRRGLLHAGAGVAALARPLAALADLPVLGVIEPRPSSQIRFSRLGVGMETLDRKLFEPEKVHRHVGELGVKWARLQTGWARTERSRGEYDFAWLDGVVDSLLKLSVQPWFNVGYGNRLYTPEAVHETAVGYAPIFTPEAKKAWVAYVGRLAEHFRGRITHWEIWNEPNIANFWKPHAPAPDQYMELAKLTAPEIRKRVPGAVLLAPGLAGLGRSFAFLERCMDLGLGRLVDRISYHNYRPIPETNYENEIRALRRMLDAYRPGISIWHGESGCPSSGEGLGALSNFRWNEQAQAKWLLRRVMLDLRFDIEVTSYFHTVDLAKVIRSTGPTGKTAFFGLLRTDYTRKPSFYAYQRLCALFDSDTARADLLMQVGSGGLDGIQSAAFVRAGCPLYVYWSPTDLLQPFSTQQVSLSWWAGREGRAIDRPLLVDPLSGRVHAIEDAKAAGGFWRANALPLADYPLIVTGARAMAGLMRKTE